MLRDTILELEEGDALDILTAFAKSQKRPGKPLPEWDSGMASAISAALDVRAAYDPDDEGFNVGRGEVAKQALLVLAEDDEHAPMIKVMTGGSRPQSFGAAADPGLPTCLLTVLYTQLDFVKDDAGRWTATLRHPSDDSLALKTFASRFLAYMDQ